MAEKPINEWWEQLPSATQQWLMDNPGCQILPRSVVNAINEATGASLSGDQHGERALSASDHAFLKAKAVEAGG